MVKVLLLRPTFFFVMLPSPDQNLKIGSVGRFFFFFFFSTYRERVEFSNIFFKVSKWGKLGRNAVKTHIYKCFFRPLNTNFSKFFRPNLTFSPKKKKKKKTRPCFFAFYGRSGEGNITKKKFGLIRATIIVIFIMLIICILLITFETIVP